MGAENLTQNLGALIEQVKAHKKYASGIFCIKKV